MGRVQLLGKAQARPLEILAFGHSFVTEADHGEADEVFEQEFGHLTLAYSAIRECKKTGDILNSPIPMGGG